MAPPKRLLALPMTLAAYAVGWWGIGQGEGFLGATLPWFFLLAYFGVFWGGWLAIPLLGVGATFGQPLLPEGARRPVRMLFVGWLLAWLGALLGLLLLGPPAGFEASSL